MDDGPKARVCPIGEPAQPTREGGGAELRVEVLCQRLVEDHDSSEATDSVLQGASRDVRRPAPEKYLA